MAKVKHTHQGLGAADLQIKRLKETIQALNEKKAALEAELASAKLLLDEYKTKEKNKELP